MQYYDFQKQFKRSYNNCNLTSQLLRLTKITLQKLHIPHIWPFSPSSITLVHKLLLENRISKNQKSWYSDKEILSYATCHKLKNPDSPPPPLRYSKLQLIISTAI